MGYSRKRASKRLLTTEKAAALLGISPWTLVWWRTGHRSDGPPFFRVGRNTIRYSVDDLETWLRERRVMSDAKQPQARVPM
jgi:hypothetical protein